MSDHPSPALGATTLGDLLARERRHEGLALAVVEGSLDRTYGYRDLLTTAWKAGNFLRHLGVRGTTEAPDASVSLVGVAADPLPEPVLTLLGAAGLGARVTIGSRADDGGWPTADDASWPRATVVHADDADRYDPSPGSRLVVYGGEPSSPAVDHWEQEVWSETPRAHPARVDGDDPVLVGDGTTRDHATVLSAARSVVTEAGVEPGDRVAVRASLADPRTVVAGVVAPLLAGAATAFPGEAAGGEYVVGGGPGPRRLPRPSL